MRIFLFVGYRQTFFFQFAFNLNELVGWAFIVEYFIHSANLYVALVIWRKLYWEEQNAKLL